MIDPCNFLQKIHMCEILFIDDPCLTHHAQIFNRQRNQFPLPQFIHTGTLRKDRNTKLLADQIFDGRNIVHLNGNIKIIDGFIDAL